MRRGYLSLEAATRDEKIIESDTRGTMSRYRFVIDPPFRSRRKREREREP